MFLRNITVILTHYFSQVVGDATGGGEMSVGEKAKVINMRRRFESSIFLWKREETIKEWREVNEKKRGVKGKKLLLKEADGWNARRREAYFTRWRASVSQGIK